MKRKIGFVGLGAMGKPMAMNLLKAGYEMFVYDKNPEATKDFHTAGAHVENSPQGVAGFSEVVMTMLPDSPDVKDVYTSELGLLSGAHENLILIDSSTIDPSTTQSIGVLASKLGVKMLDSPVGGGPNNAAAGTLTLMVGGPSSVVDECRGILETLGKKIIHVGPLGSGVTLKIMNNLIVGLYNCMLAEGLTLARASGLDEENFLGVLKANLMMLFENLSSKFLAKDLQPGFRTGLMYKDLRIAVQMAERHNAFLPFGSLAKEIYKLGIKRGLGSLDLTSIIKVYEQKPVNSENRDESYLDSTEI